MAATTGKRKQKTTVFIAQYVWGTSRPHEASTILGVNSSEEAAEERLCVYMRNHVGYQRGERRYKANQTLDYEQCIEDATKELENDDFCELKEAMPDVFAVHVLPILCGQ